MKRRDLRCVSVVLIVTCVSCAPSLSQLVTNHHYREAVCAAVDGTKNRQEFVTNALIEDAAVALHVHNVTAQELEPLLGASTSRVLQKTAFLRVRVQSNILPLDDLELGGVIRDSRGRAGAAPASWETLAWATGERLPPSVTRSTYLTERNFLMLIGAVATGGLALMFGSAAPGGYFQPEDVEMEAPLSEYQHVAPLSSSLHESMTSVGCQDLSMPNNSNHASPRAGSMCEVFFLVEPSGGVGGGEGGDWQLEIQQRFIAHRVGGELLSDEEQRCVLDVRSTVTLGPALRDQMESTFGSQMLLLSELESSRAIETP